ncbi:MAG: CDP-glycerol--glycerophosphate glycerophosphotransferase [Treponema sp.]|nr:CDP-glycerol--glycerophosphate glycerophosphotransferase [Treponema sp.]
MTDTMLYIDPGTGSMLFSLIMALATTTVFVGREAFIKLKFLLSGGRARKADSKRIPIVIYSDHKRYWNVFKPVLDEAERRGVDITYYTQSADDPALSEPYAHIKAKFIGEGNRGFARLNFLKADVVLSTTPGLDVYQWKRSRDVGLYVHIPHTADELLGYRMFGMDSYDAVLLTGEFQGGYIRRLEKLRGEKEKDLAVVGSTFLDGMRARLGTSGTHPSAGGRLSVLLAPSWGKDAILSKYGGRILDALLATGFDITIRPHPQTLSSEKDIVGPLQEKYPDTEMLHWNYDNDNFPVLERSDILITDFSGIILEYALIFGKSLIYADTQLDTSPYDAAWIDEPVWRLRILPEIGVRLDEADFPNMRELVENAVRSEAQRRNRERISGEAWQNKGRAAEAVLDYLVAKQQELSHAPEAGVSGGKAS